MNTYIYMHTFIFILLCPHVQRHMYTYSLVPGLSSRTFQAGRARDDGFGLIAPQDAYIQTCRSMTVVMPSSFGFKFSTPSGCCSMVWSLSYLLCALRTCCTSTSKRRELSRRFSEWLNVERIWQLYKLRSGLKIQNVGQASTFGEL